MCSIHLRNSFVVTASLVREYRTVVVCCNTNLQIIIIHLHIIIMWYCIFSSFLFLSNAIVSYMYSQYLVGNLWLLLMFTSAIYHDIRLFNTRDFFLTKSIVHPNKTNFWLQLAYVVDISAIFAVIGYVLYNHFRKMSHTKFTAYTILLNTLIFSLLGYIAFVYCYGKYTQQYCFHKYSNIAEGWHSTIHLSASGMHHLTLLV